jgi:hypothetical protein
MMSGMAENWPTKVTGRTETEALALADQRAAEHFAGAPYSRTAVQRQHETKDAVGTVLRVHLLVIYTAN